MIGGNPSPVDPRLLMDGSKTLTGGDLWCYLISREERINRSTQLFEWLRDGKITLPDPTIYKLSEGRAAHDFLETGKSAGKVLLIP
jgi:NADPH2:quinone reductase